MDKKLQRHNEWVSRFNAAARRQSRGAPPLNTDKPSLPKLGLHQSTEEFSEESEELFEEKFFEESEKLFERAKARVWLRELDRLSDTALWFEKFARRYDSEIDAAVDLLRNERNKM